MVIATQNPVEYEGTYPLPEAQLDRFMVRSALGYPPANDEAEMLADHATSDRVLDLEPVADVGEILAAQDAAAAVHAERRRCAATWSRCSSGPAATRAPSSARARAPA